MKVMEKERERERGETQIFMRLKRVASDLGNSISSRFFFRGGVFVLFLSFFPIPHFLSLCQFLETEH